MFLEFALQKGRGEIVELAALGYECSGLQSVMVAVFAAFLLPENHILQKGFHIIPFLVDDPEGLLVGISSQGLLTTKAFLVRMDVAVVEKTCDVKTL